MPCRRARMAARPRCRNRADLGGSRPDRAELHPELAGEASRRQIFRPRTAGSTGPRSASCTPACSAGRSFPSFRRSGRSCCSARRSICGACCAGAAARRPPSRCCWFFTSAMPGWCWVRRLLGLAMLDADPPQSAAIHALTAGAIGTMTLAVMTRATRGHTGRALSADRATPNLLARHARRGHPGRRRFPRDWTMPLLVVSAGFWIGAFGLFVSAYGPMLLLSTADKLVPSGSPRSQKGRYVRLNVRVGGRVE